MIESVGATAVGAAIAVGVTLIGAVIAAVLTAMQNMKGARKLAALELSESEGLYYNFKEGGWSALAQSIAKIEVHLQICGVPANLIRAFRKIEEAAWRDCALAVDLTDQPGVNLELVNADREVRVAILDTLFRRGTRSERSRSSKIAVGLVDRVVPDVYWPSRLTRD